MKWHKTLHGWWLPVDIVIQKVEHWRNDKVYKTEWCIDYKCVRLTDEEDKPLSFDTPEDAEKWLRENSAYYRMLEEE